MLDQGDVPKVASLEPQVYQELSRRHAPPGETPARTAFHSPAVRLAAASKDDLVQLLFGPGWSMAIKDDRRLGCSRYDRKVLSLVYVGSAVTAGIFRGDAATDPATGGVVQSPGTSRAAP
jgi:hypothetical protein